MGHLSRFLFTTSGLVMAAACLPMSAAAQTLEPGPATAGAPAADADPVLPGNPAVQSAADAQPESDIVVTGIRASQLRAIDTKRSAINSVDAIASEDIGKLPDQNVAESLERVPGISIERNRGVGNGVAVRGLGPQFNTVTVNGRVLATTSAGREFNFDILPSELISGAAVYKSPQANVNGASIGATINIQTLRPLEQKAGVRGGGSARLAYNELGDNTTPSGAAYLTWKNEGGTFGASIVASFDRRNERTDNFSAPASAGPRGFDDGVGYYGSVTNLNNTLCVGSVVNGTCNSRIDTSRVTLFRGVDMLRNFINQVEFSDRKRLGVNGTLQYRPSPELTFTVDGLISDQRERFHSSGIVPDFSGGTLINQVVEGGTTQTETIAGLSRTVQIGGRAVSQTYANGTVDEIVSNRTPRSTTTLVGFNTRWERGPFTVSLDLDTSLARYRNADALFTTIRMKGINHTFDTRTDTPIAEFNVSAPGVNNVATNVNNRFGHYVQAGDGQISQSFSDRIKEGRLDGSWDGNAVKLYAGAGYSERTKTTIGYSTKNPCAYCGSDVPLPGSLFTPTGFGFFNGKARGNATEWVDYNTDALFDAMLRLNTTSDPALHSGNLTRVEQDFAASSKVAEEVTLGYLMGEYSGELGQMPVAINGGLRFEHTRIASEGFGQTVVSARPTGAGQNLIVLSPLTPLSFKGSYSNFLPSLNVRVNLTDELIFRTAGSRVLSRPTLTDLSSAQAISSNPGNERISRGNPNLQPFKAWQLEAGLEWYYTRESLASATFFYKSIDSFISRGVTRQQVDQASFIVDQPINGQGAKVKGVEVALRTAFRYLPAPFDGFGTQLSYTYTDSDASYRNPAGTYFSSYSLQGLSKNTLAGQLYYEKGPLQARASYAWRDDYLVVPQTQTGVPLFSGSYGQLDAGVQYSVTDNLILTVNGTNLTDAKEFAYANVVQNTQEYRRVGRRYAAGVRVRF